MRTFPWLLLIHVLFACWTVPESLAVEYLSEDGGDWHATTTWRSGRVPSHDNDTMSIYATAPLTVDKGSKSTATYYFYYRNKAADLEVAPLAHLSVLNSFANHRHRDVPVKISVQGSLTLQGGAFLYGPVSFRVQGGYVFGLGRRWSLSEYKDKAPVIDISDGGMFAVRSILIGESAVINIDGGEARFDGLDFGGSASLNINSGVLAVEQVTGAEMAKITLGDKGQLFLKGDVDASNIQKFYPGIAIHDENGKRELESLSYSPGSDELTDFTCITLQPRDAAE